MNGGTALTLISLALGCQVRAQPARDTELRRVVLTAPGLPSSAFESVTLEPRAALRRATRRGVSLELELELEGRNARVEIRSPEACPLTLHADQWPQAGPLHARLVPLLTLRGPAAEVGFDAPFELTLQTGCVTGARGTVAWELTGEPLATFTVSEQGYRVVGRTRAMPPALAGVPPGQIVAVSPAARAQTNLTMRWTSPRGKHIERSFAISAAPRSRGLPNFAFGDRILLGGSDYTVRTRPRGALAEPMPWGALTSLLPDVAGTWELETNGRRVRVHAATYDSVPLDCGRSECHAAEARGAQDSPMTSTLARLLEAPLAPAELACTFGCHTTGEPFAADGGFSHALRDFELHPEQLPAFTALPRALRRMGGVGCVACHGPAQIPEPAARWAILSSAVCAYCHDAPPRYGHVAAWRASGMSRADAQRETRTTAECASCHTTWGFLETLGGQPGRDRMPPDAAGSLGIACAACHAVHAEDAVKPGLLRRVPLAAAYAKLPVTATERSSACIACHTPELRTGSGPSSALIWAGSGVDDPLSGEPLVGGAPHAAVPGGCVGCHSASSAADARGGGHDFRADPSRCTSCHAERPIEYRIFERARHLLGVTRAAREPPHARPGAVVSVADRARGLARLVLEDRGAAVHNPRYAEALLDRAALLLAHESDAAH